MLNLGVCRRGKTSFIVRITSNFGLHRFFFCFKDYYSLDFEQWKQSCDVYPINVLHFKCTVTCHCICHWGWQHMQKVKIDLIHYKFRLLLFYFEFERIFIESGDKCGDGELYEWIFCSPFTFPPLCLSVTQNDDSNTWKVGVFMCEKWKTNNGLGFCVFNALSWSFITFFVVVIVAERESLLLLCLLFCFVIITQNFWTQSTEFMVFCDPESPFTAFISVRR